MKSTTQNASRIGRPTTTSRMAILQAAEELLIEGGEAALSFRRLASKLGLSAPSIYTYFPSKQALLIALTESTFTLDLTTSYKQDDIVATLTQLLNHLHRQLLEKQHLMSLFNQAMPAGVMIFLIEQIAQMIEKTGIEHGVALRYAQSLLWMLFGFVLFETNSKQESVRAPFAEIPEYAETLSHLDIDQHGRLWQETLDRNLLFLAQQSKKTNRN